MVYVYDSELYHHGIEGQRWGVRRFQNPDGTLTAEGKRRYNKTLNKELKKVDKYYDKPHLTTYINSKGKTRGRYVEGLKSLNKKYDRLKAADENYELNAKQKEKLNNTKKQINKLLEEKDMEINHLKNISAEKLHQEARYRKGRAALSTSLTYALGAVGYTAATRLKPSISPDSIHSKRVEEERRRKK